MWGGALEQHTGPQSLFVELRRNKKRDCRLVVARGGGGAEQHKGPQSLFVE